MRSITVTYSLKAFRPIKPGDVVTAALWTGHRSGFSCAAEIRAVYHWGVFAKIVDSKEVQHFRADLQDAYMKRQFKVKWRHIYSIHLK